MNGKPPPPKVRAVSRKTQKASQMRGGLQGQALHEENGRLQNRIFQERNHFSGNKSCRRSRESLWRL